MILLKQMLILFLLMLVGWALARKGELDDKVSGFLSSLIVNVANPCLILSGCLDPNALEQEKFITTLKLAVGVYAGLIVLAELFMPLFLRRKEEKNVYKVMFVFSNMGFMGFPIIAAMYGNDALLYGSPFMLMFDSLIYTYGLHCIAGKVEDKKQALKNCLNPGVIACIFTFIISFTRIEIPDIAAETIMMLSNLAAPLSMMVIGASFATMDYKEIFGDWKLMIFSAVKLVVFPIAVFPLIRLVTDDSVLQGISLVILATPVGSMSAMLARQYGGDYKAASKGIAITTVLSIVTLPLVFMILGL